MCPSYPARICQRIGFLGLLLSLPVSGPAAEFGLSASSYLGSSSDDDSVKGVFIQSDGTVVLAANLGDAQPGGLTPVLLNGASLSTAGCLVRLRPDGRSVLSVTRLADTVQDLAGDEADNLYVAAGYSGLLRLDATATTVHYHVLNGSYAYRVDASPAGKAVCLVPSNISTADEDAGPGQLHLFDEGGIPLAGFSGKNNTQDVAIDDVTQSVFIVGYRQASSFGPPGEGCQYLPVQIAYTRAYDFSGVVRWTGYDWSTQTNYNAVTDSYEEGANGCLPAGVDAAKINPRFLNKFKNNMADTRGYRVVMGRDGYLYFAFESAGGNHIFRDHPFDLGQPGSIVGGDFWHQFTNTGASHKTYLGRYHPATGQIVLGNQFNSVTTTNNTPGANALRIKAGGLAVDELGRIYLAGESSWALPFFPSTYHVPHPDREVFNPFGAWGYAGGAFLWVQSADFLNRDYVTRLGFGRSQAVAARFLAGQSEASIAYGGSLTLSSGPAYLQDAIQSVPGYGSKDGFLAVFGGVTGGTGGSHYRFTYGEGASYTTGASLRNSAPASGLGDHDGDGVDDLLSEYPYSESTPLSPTSNYTGPAFFGGFRGKIYNSTTQNWSDYQVNSPSQLNLRLQPLAPVSTTVHGILYFPKSSMSGLPPNTALSFDRNSLVYCDAKGATNGRWIIRQDGLIYVSALKIEDNAYLSFTNDTDDGEWALWPHPESLDFDASNALFQTRNFSAIDGLGLLVDKDTPTPDRFWLTMETLWADFAVDHVDNLPPSPAFTAIPDSGSFPLTVVFDASSSSDSDGLVSFYSWTFDNDTSSAGPAESTTYPAAGPYRPSLKIWDDDLTTAGRQRPLWVYGDLGGDTARMAAALGGTMGSATFERYATASAIDLDGDGADDSTAGSPFSVTSPLGSNSIEGTLLYGGFLVQTYDAEVGAADRGYSSSKIALRIQSSGGGSLLHAALYLDKSQFLNRAASKSVTLDGTSSFKIAGIARFENLGSVRWLIRNGENFYVSEMPLSPSGGTASLTFPSASDHGRWAPYDPVAQQMNFDAAGAVFSTHQFSDVTGIGFLIDKDTPTANRLWIEFAKMEFIASFDTDNSPPTAGFSASLPKVDILQPVTFDAAPSTSSGDLVDYFWNFGDGTTATGQMVTHLFSTLGNKTVTLTVTDDLGRTASASLSYPVAANQPPLPAITATPASGPVPLAVVFDASESSDDGTLVHYEWDFTGDGSWDATGLTANHTYAGIGYYTATLRVTDDGSKTATVTVPVSATDPQGRIPPIAVLDASPSSGVAPLTVTFSGLASRDDNGSIVSQAWDLDNDGQYDDQAGSTFSYTYISAGSFPVGLQVTDNEGATATASVIITVTVPPGAETIVNWNGDYVTASKAFRNGTPSVGNGLDLDGDGGFDDRQVYYPYIVNTPLSPASGYSGTHFYGGIWCEVLNNAGTTMADQGVLQQASPPDMTSLRWQTTTSGQEGRWHWVLFFDKSDFLNGGDAHPVDFTSNSRLEIGGINRFDNTGAMRWLVRDGTQFFVSQATFNKGSGVASLTFASDESDGAWAIFDPLVSLDFDATGAVFANRNFSDITAVGFVVDKDVFSAVRHWFDYKRFTMWGRIHLDPVLNFDSWISDPDLGVDAADRDPGSDPDGDGLDNLLEFALGLHPLVASEAGRPAIEIMPSGPDRFLAITYRQRRGGVGTHGIDYQANGIVYEVGFSHDLVQWHSGSSFVTAAGPPVDNLDGTENVTIRTLVPIAVEPPAQFLQLRIFLP